MEREVPNFQRQVLIQLQGFTTSMLNIHDYDRLMESQPECQICTAPFEVDALLTRLPCNFGHIFHYLCIFPSLVRGK